MKNKQQPFLLAVLLTVASFVAMPSFAKSSEGHYPRNFASNEMTKTSSYFADGDAVADFSSTKTEIYALESVAFVDQSTNATSWKWTFPGGSPSSSTERYPIVSYNTPGTYSVTLVINEGTSDEATELKNSYLLVSEKTGETVSVGAGNGVATAWPLGGGSYRQTGSIAIYTASEINRPNGGIIDALSWNMGSASTATRQLLVYIEETSDTQLSATSWNNVTAALPATPSFSSATFSCTKGLNTIWLDTPFDYSGTANLKVTVYTMGVAGNMSNSNGQYSYSLNQHVRWSSGSTATMATGTVEANRPNIQFLFNGHEAAAPKADFLTSSNRLAYLENFDASTSLPAGWETEIVTGTTPSITIKNYHTAATSYGLIDSNNVYSVVMNANGNYAVNMMLKSGTIKLPENAKIEFAILYKEKLATADAPVNLLLSTDNGANWTQVWTTGPANVSNVLLWHDVSVDLSEYSGQNVRLAWQEKGSYAHVIALDNIRILASANGKLNVLEGDYLQFTDKSTGPAVLWQWTLPGSETGSSSDQNPRVRYPDAGTYSVTLTVKNTEGTDTKNEEGIVVVSPSSPNVEFESTASSGFTRMRNFGKFITKGTTVSYTDKSAHKPTSWSWTFAGGNITSSNQSSVAVSYHTNGVFDTKLKAGNAMGVDSISIAEYIKVGGTDSIWNMPAADLGNSVYFMDPTKVNKGYLTGQNEYKFLAYSERFAKPGKGIISDVLLNLYVSNLKSEVFQVQICAERPDGTPGVVLASVDLPVSEMKNDDYTSVHFPIPAKVSGPFHVVLRGFDDYSTNPTTVVIKSSQKQTGGGTAYFYDFRSNKWYAYNSVEASQFGSPKLSLNMVPVLTYTELEVETQPLSFEAAGGNQSISVSSNIEWETFASASWLMVSKTGDNAVSVTCAQNNGAYRAANIYVRGGGDEKIIKVTQAGNSSIVLTGELNANNPDTKELLWTSAPANEAALLGWSNGKPQYGVSNGTATIVGAVRWQPGDLAMYSQATVTAIDLYVAAQGTYTAKIYNGNTLAHTQVLENLKTGQYNRIELSQPVTIDLLQDFMISYFVENYAAGVTPLVYDSGTPVTYKGDLISLDGGQSYADLAELLPEAHTGNWCFSAVIEGTLKENFNVYRDNIKLTTISEKTYSDNVAGGYTYKVANVLVDGSNGQISNTVTLGDAYDADEIAALKAFLRQPSNTAGQINANRVGVSDTSSWNASNIWISNLTGVTFEKINNINRVKTIAWSMKNFAGTLNLSPCVYMTNLDVNYNIPSPTSPNVNKISVLDITGCIGLTSLRCEGLPLVAGLNLSGNINLTYLDAYSCGLTSLDVSKNTKLSILLCDYNSLESLDLSLNGELTSLTCNNNQLKTLDISTNTKLAQLTARDNKIEKLIFPAQGIATVNIKNNKLKFSTLPDKKYTTYTYSPQAVIDGGTIDYTDGIDLNKEYQTTIDGTVATTTFNWFDITNGTETAIALTGTNGVFTLTSDMLNKKLRCKMTNTNFPNFTTTNPLVYEVEVKTVSCHAPQNVSVTTDYSNGCSAQIVWAIPATGENVFNVYRDDVLIMSNVSGTSYTDVDYTTGLHTWCVKSVCGVNESAAACASENCTPPSFTITTSAGAGGVITPAGAITAFLGQSRTFTITPSVGYKISQVLVDGVNDANAVNSGSYTFENINANHTISATFEKKTYTITATVGANGTISPSGTTTVTHGGNQLYTITASNDYLIKEVKVDGIAESAATGKTTYSYTFSNVTANHTISAEFEIATPELKTITINTHSQTVSSAMTYMAACGEQSVSMTLTAVGEVKVNGAAYTNGSPISLTGDKTVITITVTAGSNTATYTLTVAKALGSTTPLYIERWGATLAIVNNPANNGGYTFDQIQWYKASDNTPAGTGAYVVGNLNTHYADVHTPATNAWHHTCKVKATAAPAQIVVYPNPVRSGQPLSVTLPEGVSSVRIEVYDMSGKLLRRHPQVATSLTAPTGTGVYLLKILLPDGTLSTEKIVVQ